MIKTHKLFSGVSISKLLFLIFGFFFLLKVGEIIAVKETIYIFAFFGAIAYFIATVKYPEMALAGFLAINYVGALRPFIGFGMTRVFFGGVVLGSGCYLVRSIINRSVQIKMDSLQLMNLLFSFWLLINLIAHCGLVEGYGLVKFRDYFLYSLIPFYAVTIFQNDPIRIERFVPFYVLFLTSTSAILFLIFGNSSEVLTRLVTSGRFTVFGDAINFSLPFISGAVMSIYLFFQTDNKYFKTAALICMSYFFYILLLSGTRQSVGAAILGVAIFSFLMIKRKTSLIPLAVSLIVMWLFYSNLQEGALLNRYSPTWQDHIREAQSRFFHYQASFDLFLQFPLIGVGLGEYGRHAVPGMLSAHTHNLILEILAEEGLVGFFLFLGFLWFPIKKGVYIMKKLGRSDSRFPLVCLFFSIIIAELFRSNFSGGIGSRTILWFSVGALWVITTSKYLGNNDSYKRRDLTVIASLRQDDKKTLI